MAATSLWSVHRMFDSSAPLVCRGRWARGFAAVLKQAAMLSAANSPPVHIIAHANSIPPHTD